MAHCSSSSQDSKVSSTKACDPLWERVKVGRFYPKWGQLDYEKSPLGRKAIVNFLEFLSRLGRKVWKVQIDSRALLSDKSNRDHLGGAVPIIPTLWTFSLRYIRLYTKKPHCKSLDLWAPCAIQPKVALQVVFCTEYPGKWVFMVTFYIQSLPGAPEFYAIAQLMQAAFVPQKPLNGLGRWPSG